MQQSIHLRIPDISAPREAAVDFQRPRSTVEPSLRFDDVLTRQLSTEREEFSGNSRDMSETRHEGPVAVQDDRMRVDREGPSGRDERTDSDMKSMTRREDVRDKQSDIKNKETDARREAAEPGRRETGVDSPDRKKAEEASGREAILPGARKAAGMLRENQAVRRKTGPGDEESVSRLQQRLDAVESLLARSTQGGREFRDVRAALADVRDVLQSRGGRADRDLLNALGERLRELAKRVEIGQASGRDARLAPVRDEIQRIADMANRLAKRSDRPGAQGRLEDADQQQPRTAPVDRVIVSQGFGGKDQADSSSPKDGNSSAFGFQFSKGAQGADRSTHATPLPRQNPLFEEQLQSLVRNARVVVQDAKNGSFQMRLYPESLSRVNVSLGLEQGTITGRFLVETVEARQALVEQLADIRERLAESGISVGEFQVNVRGDERHTRQSAREGLRLPDSGAPVEAGGKYEMQAVRRHDGYIDVTI